MKYVKHDFKKNAIMRYCPMLMLVIKGNANVMLKPNYQKT